MGRAGRRSRGVAAVVVSALLAGCWDDRGHPPEVTDAQAIDVNAGGSIVVAASSSERGVGYVLTPDDQWLPIGTLDPAASVQPMAINDAGTVVGQSHTTGVFGEIVTTAFVWDATAGIRPLDAVTGEAHQHVTDISDNGHIVGYDGPTTGWIWEPGASSRVLAPLPGYTSSVATAVNDAGLVVGESRWGSEPDTSTLWAPPAYAPVALDRDGAASSQVADIDEDGTMVGNLVWDDQGEFESKAVVWDAAGDHAVRYLDADPNPDKVQFHSFAAAVDGGVVIGSESGCVLGDPVCGGRDWQVAWNAATGARAELYADPNNDHPHFSALDGDHLVGHHTVDEDGTYASHIVSRGRPTV